MGLGLRTAAGFGLNFDSMLIGRGMVLVGFTVSFGLRVGCLGVGWLCQPMAYYGFWQSAFEPLKFA